MAVCSRNMASLRKFQIIFAHYNNKTRSAKIAKNFVRLGIFLEQTAIIVIFTLSYISPWLYTSVFEIFDQLPTVGWLKLYKENEAVVYIVLILGASKKLVTLTGPESSVPVVNGSRRQFKCSASKWTRQLATEKLRQIQNLKKRKVQFFKFSIFRMFSNSNDLDHTIAEPPNDTVSRLRFSPNGQFICSGSWANDIRVWQIATQVQNSGGFSSSSERFSNFRATLGYFRSLWSFLGQLKALLGHY